MMKLSSIHLKPVADQVDHVDQTYWYVKDQVVYHIRNETLINILDVVAMQLVGELWN